MSGEASARALVLLHTQTALCKAVLSSIHHAAGARERSAEESPQNHARLLIIHLPRSTRGAASLNLPFPPLTLTVLIPRLTKHQAILQ
ncbi:hypothetical protein E2C01_070783 [Portunus trituberculatus]|uniref:Uncharacterized protein n=1 Tax=Portunus trituberculatus TaxID=210409 RepID=A0A5B7I297_PORTR|nr:hypothetical protein [Portunus trituberculatus]